MILTLLQVVHPEADGLMASQSTRKEHSQKGAISLPFHSLAVRCLPKRMALIGCQPIAERDSQFLDPFYTANARREISAEKAAVGCLVSKTAHSTQS
jgi:hypothetical protein